MIAPRIRAGHPHHTAYGIPFILVLIVWLTMVLVRL
jgi:hypothetical protein